MADVTGPERGQETSSWVAALPAALFHFASPTMSLAAKPGDSLELVVRPGLWKRRRQACPDQAEKSTTP